MNKIDRSKDVMTHADDLEFLHSFKNVPVFMGCVDQESDQDIFSDADWYISRGSGILQLNPLLPQELVYQSAHNPGVVGSGWIKHHEEFAKFICRYSPNKVYEIGGSHGILSEKCDAMRSIDWTIIEPNPVPVQGLKAKMIRGFFDADTPIPDDIDMLVHSHVLEHVYQPVEFFLALQRLRENTMMCFSVPALRRHLEQKFSSILHFEHTYFCSEEFIEYCLKKYGFELLEKREYSNDHSIFYAARKVSSTDADPAIVNHYSDNRRLFLEFVQYHEQLIQDLNEFLSSTQDKVYVFGAHYFTQILVSLGLHTEKILGILDNDKSKQGLRLYGTNLEVLDPGILKDQRGVTVILKCGVHNPEIKRGIQDNINSQVSYIE